jgi:LytS/YehU family sensor histidine kinase
MNPKKSIDWSIVAQLYVYLLPLALLGITIRLVLGLSLIYSLRAFVSNFFIVHVVVLLAIRLLGSYFLQKSTTRKSLYFYLYIIGILILSFILSLGATLLYNSSNPLVVNTHGYAYIAAYCINLTSSYLVFYLYIQIKSNKNKSEERLYLLKVTALSRESEIARLRSQVNPHFLFNSINAIISESHDHKLVEEIGRELANVLRYNLSQTSEAASFSNELDVILSYLRVSKVRFEDNLEYKTNISDQARAVRTPQPLLLPLIENALKYSFITTKGRVLITIDATVKEGYLIAVVENTGSWVEPQVPAKAGTQLGLSNLKARLELEFQDQATITIEKLNYSVRVTVIVPVTV